MKSALKGSDNGCAEGGSEWGRVRWPIESKQSITRTPRKENGPEKPPLTPPNDRGGRFRGRVQQHWNRRNNGSPADCQVEPEPLFRIRRRTCGTDFRFGPGAFQSYPRGVDPQRRGNRGARQTGKLPLRRTPPRAQAFLPKLRCRGLHQSATGRRRQACRGTRYKRQGLSDRQGKTQFLYLRRHSAHGEWHGTHDPRKSTSAV